MAEGLPQRLSFGTVDLDPLEQPAAVRASAPSTASGQALRLIQFDRAIQQADLDRLAAVGLRSLQYYPHGAYLLWGDAAALSRAASLSGVRWVGDFAPAWKLAADLGDRAGLIDQVLVHFYNDGDPTATLAALQHAGAELLRDATAQPDGRFHEAIVRIDANRLAALTELPHVLWLGYQSPTALRDDEMSAQIVAANFNDEGAPVPGYLAFLDQLGLSGAGVVWSIIDDGIDLGHPEFQGRIAGGYDYPGCLPGSGPGEDGPAGGHGSHVAGIVAGAGVGGFGDLAGFKYGIGMAPGVQLYSQNPLCGPAANWPPAGGWQVLSQHALAGGATGGNASWTTSEGARHGYQASERLFDFAVRDGDFETANTAEAFHFIFSAGNSGPSPSSLTSPKEAKNIISVGASRNFRTGPGSGLPDFSSRGPAVDGRLLPTLVAPGESITSSRRRAGGLYCNQPIPLTDGLYAYCLGTSMAAPHVSGLAILLIEWWRDVNAGANPSPAMLKVLLIEGARPLDERQDSSIAPDNDKGWGLAGLPSPLADEPLGWFGIDQSAVFDAAGEIHRYAFQPLDPSQPVRLILSWTDAPGAIGASPALVNDLDLQLQLGQHSYVGNQILASGSVPGGAPDRLNNVEAIFLGATAEPFVVRVLAHALPGDGVPLSGDETDQDYALLCTNCAPVRAIDFTLDPAQAAVCAPTDGAYMLSVEPIGDYVEPIALSVEGLADGLLATTNPAILTELPAQVAISIGGTAQVAAGDYVPSLRISAPEADRLLDLPLRIVDQAPFEVTLLTPLENAMEVDLRPLLRWIGPPDSASYRLEIDDDPDFASPIIDLNLNALEYRPTEDLAALTGWYWRVSASNACGSITSATQSFVTRPAAGSCPSGQQPMPLLRDTINPAHPGWTHSAVLGSDTWSISNERSLSPEWSWKVRNGFSRSDQRLLSPLIRLPPGEAAYLRFSHWYALESRDQQLCWDGGQLFLADASNAFRALPLTRYLQGGPTREFSEGNPAAGAPAWCGTQDFSATVLDLRDDAGSSLRLGFRLTSDSFGSREGWYVDDVEVYSCVAEDLIFRNGLGAEAR